MGKSAIEYVSLKKIIKRHYKKSNQKFMVFNGKDMVVIKLGNYGMYVSKEEFKHIQLKIGWKRGYMDDIIGGDIFYEEDITNLDRLFKLLAHKCKLLLELANDKKLVSDI